MFNMKYDFLACELYWRRGFRSSGMWHRIIREWLPVIQKNVLSPSRVRQSKKHS